MKILPSFLAGFGLAFLIIVLWNVYQNYQFEQKHKRADVTQFGYSDILRKDSGETTILPYIVMTNVHCESVDGRGCTAPDGWEYDPVKATLTYAYKKI